jgi:hypothetical protein
MTIATTPERPASLPFGRFAGKPLATLDDSCLAWACAFSAPAATCTPPWPASWSAAASWCLNRRRCGSRRRRRKWLAAAASRLGLHRKVNRQRVTFNPTLYVESNQ